MSAVAQVLVAFYLNEWELIYVEAHLVMIFVFVYFEFNEYKGGRLKNLPILRRDLCPTTMVMGEMKLSKENINNEKRF